MSEKKSFWEKRQECKKGSRYAFVRFAGKTHLPKKP